MGVQCWVEARVPDARAAAGFYSALFDWEANDGTARLGGRAVAGFAPGTAPAWITYARVASVDAAVRTAVRAGGAVLERSGRRALLADPAGAPFGVCETGGAELVNAPGSWDLSTLRTPDTGAAEAFYGTLFGWRAQPYGTITLWRLPGHAGGVPGQPVPRDTVAVMSEHPRAGWSVDFRVDDADATARRAVGLGATLETPPHDVPGFRVAELVDPQGAAFTVTRFT